MLAEVARAFSRSSENFSRRTLMGRQDARTLLYNIMEQRQHSTDNDTSLFRHRKQCIMQTRVIPSFSTVHTPHARSLVLAVLPVLLACGLSSLFQDMQASRFHNHVGGRLGTPDRSQTLGKRERTTMQLGMVIRRSICSFGGTRLMQSPGLVMNARTAATGIIWSILQPFIQQTLQLVL